MKLPVFLLSLCLLAVTGCRHYDNVYEVLAANGFSGMGYLICQIRKDNVLKGVTADELMLLVTLKRSQIVRKVAVVPKYTIYFQNGGFFRCQTITIYTDASGNGYMDYHCLWRRVTFFNCPDLPNICEEVFKRSDIIPGRFDWPAVSRTGGPNKTLQPTPGHVEDAAGLSEALKRDSRFSSVSVHSMGKGRVVLILAPEALPLEDRAALNELVRHYTNRGVTYKLRRSTPPPNR